MQIEQRESCKKSSTCNQNVVGSKTTRVGTYFVLHFAAATAAYAVVCVTLAFDKMRTHHDVRWNPSTPPPDEHKNKMNRCWFQENLKTIQLATGRAIANENENQFTPEQASAMRIERRRRRIASTASVMTSPMYGHRDTNRSPIANIRTSNELLRFSVRWRMSAYCNHAERFSELEKYKKQYLF
jgi:hypothetical protein